MLDKVLKLNPEVDRIDGHFIANPFMAGCRCYLRAAAKVGFKYVQTRLGCEAEFTSENYVDVCNDLLKKKCAGSAKLFKNKV